MPNPFYTAQADAGVDPSQGQVPGGPGPGYPDPTLAGAPYPDPSQGGTPPHQIDEIGALRDSILQQFPDLSSPEEAPLELDTTQKLALFGAFLADPSGTADIIRQRRERQAKRDEMRAEMGLKATGIAGELLKSQNEASRGILEMHLKANADWRERKTQEFNEHIARGKLALEQSKAAREARQQSDSDQFNQAILQNMNTGTDPGGNPVSTPGGGTAGGPGGPGGMRRSMTVGPKGASLTLSDPAAGASRDPRVDFDGWLRGFIARFPGGILPPHLSPDSPDGYNNLVSIWQKERSNLVPGSFGAAGGSPAPHTAGPVRPQSGVAGYDNPQDDQIEAFGR